MPCARVMALKSAFFVPAIIHSFTFKQIPTVLACRAPQVLNSLMHGILHTLKRRLEQHLYFLYQHHARKYPVARYSGQNNSCRTFIRVRCFLRTCQALKWERNGRIFTSCLVLTGQLAMNLHGPELCDFNIYHHYRKCTR